jgi:hypothetical protein
MVVGQKADCKILNALQLKDKIGNILREETVRLAQELEGIRDLENSVLLNLESL